ncbi:MAG TPA: hypothetical protein VD932_09005 [Aquabacterium sp.]|nr:hypothetical protein [Aquabacterium sp.]
MDTVDRECLGRAQRGLDAVSKRGAHGMKALANRGNRHVLVGRHRARGQFCPELLQGVHSMDRGSGHGCDGGAGSSEDLDVRWRPTRVRRARRRLRDTNAHACGGKHGGDR